MFRYNFLLLLCCTVLVLNLFLTEEVNATPCGFYHPFKKHPKNEPKKPDKKPVKKPKLDIFEKSLALLFGK